MNAQDKAKQLVEKMYSVVDTRGLSMMSEDNAKQCAKIAVDALIEQNGELYLFKSCENTMKYYRQKNGELFEVKTEIEKM
jgi:hypothetical protein